jgi:hypothetical protein
MDLSPLFKQVHQRIVLSPLFLKSSSKSVLRVYLYLHKTIQPYYHVKVDNEYSLSKRKKRTNSMSMHLDRDYIKQLSMNTVAIDEQDKTVDEEHEIFTRNTSLVLLSGTSLKDSVHDN